MLVEVPVIPSQSDIFHINRFSLFFKDRRAGGPALWAISARLAAPGNIEQPSIRFVHDSVAFRKHDPAAFSEVFFWTASLETV